MVVTVQVECTTPSNEGQRTIMRVSRGNGTTARLQTTSWLFRILATVVQEILQRIAQADDIQPFYEDRNGPVRCPSCLAYVPKSIITNMNTGFSFHVGWGVGCWTSNSLAWPCISVRCFLTGRGRAVPVPGRAPTTPSGAVGPVESAVAATGCAAPSSNSRFFPLTAEVAVHGGGALVGTVKRGAALVGVGVVSDG